MNRVDVTSAEFFDERYRAVGDPWNFATDAYEQGRYRAILCALTPGRYRSAFEPGCSVGVLTEQLAGIADAVWACDFSETAVAAAQGRCAGLSNVRITCGALQTDLPWPGFDLVVLSEIGYYFTLENWHALVDRMCRELSPGATVLGCHWLGHSPDHILHGDAVHDALAANPLLQHHLGERYAAGQGETRGAADAATSCYTGFRLDVWRRR